MRNCGMRQVTITGLALVAMATTSWAGDAPGPIDSLQDLQDTGKMVFKLADENNDGQISQKEAIDAGNLAVGGFFFRADANGDGVLSKDEAKQARDQFMAQNPLLRVVLAKNPNIRAAANGNVPAGTPAGNAAQAFETLLDANNDGQLQASEVRAMVQTTVTALYATADTDRSGGLNPTEVNAAMIGMAKAAAQAAFQAADLDRNGQLSQAEFDKAIIEPAHAVFRTIDANNDGQISQDEAQSAERAIASQVRMFRVPEPANSASNLIRSGRKPTDVSPVPNFAPPATASPR